MTYRKIPVVPFNQRNYSKERFVVPEYRDIKDPYKKARQVALDSSDNGRCWWIYQHILNYFMHPTSY
tara:strand:+ start:324 stop:524 length:201 start_codon:yes stop_codon:yes gene_type:complete